MDDLHVVESGYPHSYRFERTCQSLRPAPCDIPTGPSRDNEGMSEAAVKAMPRRGRIWVILLLALGLFGVGYLVVSVATLKPGHPVVHVAGIGDAQGLFGGVPQEGD